MGTNLKIPRTCMHMHSQQQTFLKGLLPMSRFYHALKDPRTCTKCNSACAIFGQIDVETSWFGWCTLCNSTWHNRRIESILFSVNGDFARRSLVALIGNKRAASITLTFLMIGVYCVKYNRQLRHRLNIPGANVAMLPAGMAL